MIQGSMKLAAALALAAAPSLAMAATVKVGVVLTYSGTGAQLAQQIERGMELYLAREGTAKLGEHEIELIKRDDKNPGGDAAKVAVQELIVREDVDLLTGFIYSPNIIASAPLIEQAKVPTLIMNAATAWIPSLSPYLARVSMSMWQTGFPMGRYAAEKLGCRTAAVGYTDYPPGKDSLAAFQMGFEQAGGQVVDAIPMGGPAEVPDFTPFMQRVKDARPDCFYVFVPAGNHAAAVFKTYAALGMKDAGVRLIGPGDITQDTELQGLGDVAIGVVTLGQYQADLDVGTNPEFVEAWHEAYGAGLHARLHGRRRLRRHGRDRRCDRPAGRRDRPRSHHGDLGRLVARGAARHGDDRPADPRHRPGHAGQRGVRRGRPPEDAHARRDPAGQGPVQGAEGGPLRRVTGAWSTLEARSQACGPVASRHGSSQGSQRRAPHMGNHSSAGPQRPLPRAPAAHG